MRTKNLAYLLILGILGSVFVSPIRAAMVFSVTNPQVNSDEVTVDVSITGSSTFYYIQGLLTETGKNNYFGLTQNHHGDWFTSDATPNPDYITTNFYKTNPTNDSWSGQIKVKNDIENPNYKGPGEYTLKIRRYTGNSSSSAEEKVLTISFSSVTTTTTPTPSTVIPTSSPTATPKPTNTPKPTVIPKPANTPTNTPSPTKKNTPTSVPDINEDQKDDSESQLAAVDELVLGESSEIKEIEPEKEMTPKKQNRLPLVLTVTGGCLILGTFAYLGYKHYKPVKISK